MLDLNLAQEVRHIKGNQPLLLDDPQQVWLVQSGTLALFATQVDQGEAKGARHYLFSVGEGEALFGTTLWQQWGILAVAIEATELLPLAIADLGTLIAAEAGEDVQLSPHSDNPTRYQVIAWLEGWLKHLGDFIYHNPLFVPQNVQPLGESRYLTLQNTETRSCDREQVVWVSLGNGSVRWMGIEDLKVEETSPVFPLASGMWLEAEDLMEVQVHPTTELANGAAIPAGLATLHTFFLFYLDVQVRQKKEQEFGLFLERQQLDLQVREVALGELTTVLHPQKTTIFQEGTPLLIAAGAVGRAQGMMINPPAQSEDLSRVKDPLEAIARASRFRTRRVLLTGDWWQEEHGPLLGYTNTDKSPVALLPYKGNHYVLFDPVERTRMPVTETVAQMLSPEAQMFYRPLPLFVSNALALFRFGTRGNEIEIVGVVLLGVLGTLMGMVTPQATAMLINNAIPDSDRLLLWQIGLALFVAAWGKTVFQLAQGILSLRVENSADASLQPAVWDRLLSLKPAFFRSYSSGDLLTRLLAVTQIRSQLSGATQRTLLSAVFSLLNLGLMFVYSWQLALIGIGLTLVAVIVTVVSSVILIRKNRQQEVVDGEINGLTIELINGVSKLRVAAAEGRAFAAWAKKYSLKIKLKAAIKRINDSVSVFNEALPLVSSILLFWFAILFIQMAQRQGGAGLNMGTFLAFNTAFGTFLSSVTDLSNTLTDILGIVPLWERAKPIVQTMPETDATKADPGRLTGKIALEHVTFRYREDGPLILDDVSIHAEPGEFIAMVGPSGSGKSTIFRFLLGFETPLSGTVYYDGQDLAGLDVQAVRRQLGVVLQNGRINSGSMFDNLTCGALVTLDEAWEAARMAGLAEDIEQMPMGMHTVISEGGTNLSGGQRQRLLIARAILLKPKIILMDEATSALDNRTQAIVTQSLDQLNATRIVIAHRLSTIRNANRIYVIEAGRLVEVGSFAQLVDKGGLFARLAARQLE
jgi:NHLM bacteriocin system ABC transporter ATP-binding protein